MTVFVSSHLLAEVEQIADHLVMIQAGRLVFQGAVDDLVRSHPPRITLGSGNPEEADLLADIAAALDLPARVTGTGTVSVELPLTTGDGEAASIARELNRRAHAVHVLLSRLEVRRPTLEEAFFELTGTASGDVH
jgi:ABC-2 type transport system ATP-binding protein